MDAVSPDDPGAEAMVRGAQEPRTDKDMERKGKRLSRKKSKNRSRKKRSHSKGVPEVEVEPAEADDTKESAGKLSRQNSIPSREQKTRSLSGSRKRLSGWFKRKSRSESRGRSKSETELNRVDRKDKQKRHESAEDIKRDSKSAKRDSTYEMYDITKQPRDRLKRMTVRDAVKERRLRKEASGLTLSRLDQYIDTEEVPRERTRTSSLPDISAVDPKGDNTNEYNPDESKDVIDSASPLVRGSVTLPRENKNRIGSKKQKASKAGRVSIEADSDDNIINPELMQPVLPQASARTQEKDKTKRSPSRQPSPQTQIQAVVHDVAKSVESPIEKTSNEKSHSVQAASKETPVVRKDPGKSELESFIDTAILVEKDVKPEENKSKPEDKKEKPEVNESKHKKGKSKKEDTKTKSKKTKTKDIKTKPEEMNKKPEEINKKPEEPSQKKCDNSGDKQSESEKVTVPEVEKDNDKPETSSEANNSLSQSKVPRVCVLKDPPTKAMKRWQTAILDVQKKRRKESLSRFLELSRSPNQRSLLVRGVSRDGSPGSLSKSRSPSPWSRKDSSVLDTVKDNSEKIPVNKDEVKQDTKEGQQKPESDAKSKNTLGVPVVLDRSLSDGEGRTVLEKQDKASKKCQRSPSALSDQTGAATSPKSGERNGVPVMGTSVQQKYKRTFSPKRQETPEQTNDTEKEYEKQEPEECENKQEIESSQNQDEKASEAEVPEADDKGTKPQTDGSKVSSDNDKNNDDSVMAKALENRGRDSQRRRIKSGRSFRRKKEVVEEEIKSEEVPKQEAEVEKEEVVPTIGLMYDKSTQTSEIDLTEWAKSVAKSKKNKKAKKEKEKKKAKEISSLIPTPQKEEERKLEKSNDQEENKTIDKDKINDADSEEKKDPIKTSEDPENVQENDDKPENEKSKEDGSKAKPKKLSFTTMVFLKQRIASRRKKKEQDEKGTKNKKDSNKDMFLIENEINLSKLADIKETDILDDEIIEPGIGLDLPRKQIRFEPVASDEPVQSEEPLPPLARNRAKRLSGRRENTMRDKRKKCLQCCKKFTAFLFSHIGLCSLVVAYTIMGGFIFKAIEGPFEDKVKTIIRDTRVKMVDKMLQHATELSLSEIGHDNFTAIVDEQLKQFQRTVFKETKEHGWDGKDKTDSDIPEMQWSFASSLLYAITVMTTIGYGHVAPKTDQGRIVTIGYAVLGIPLTLLCLTNIGDVMATGFRLLYGKVCCGLCCKLFRPRRRRIPDLEKGLAHQVMASEEEEADKPREVIHVPTSLCILLIAGYIFAGALLFALWEKWDYLTGSYFCFITLSTIGFGDIVPGTDLNAWSQEEKLVLCAMYLVFGLSLIAMCFNLVQEDVKAKCRWLGMKMGIIEKPESSV